MAEKQIRENVKLNFAPSFEIKEGTDGTSWLRIGGVALEEGVSRNNNKYTINNLKENDQREFKWVFGHPYENVEEHVLGKGSLSFADNKLFHEGKIRNTARHPDVVEMVKDGLLGPSIHATASTISEKDGVYEVEGLQIEGVGLVAFQGVKAATIDYAIAESFNEGTEMKESSKEDAKQQTEETKMEEQPVEAPVEEPKVEEPKVEEPKAEETPVEPADPQEALKALKEEVESLKRKPLVESIVKINSELKSNDLMKESVEQLGMILEYENKLAKKNESVGIVETEEKPAETLLERDGSLAMTKEAYESFNNEIRQRIR